MKPRSTLRPAAPLALAFAVTLVAGPGLAASVTLEPAEVRRLGIATAPARSADVLSVVDQPGVVRVPNDRLRVVTAPAEGVLVRLPVAEGQDLIEGDALAVLTGPAVAALEADYRDAADALALARAELDRVWGLVEDGVMAEKERARAEAAVRRAAGHLEAARAALEAAGTPEARLASLRSGAAPAATLTLRAREPGTVLRQIARPGERLAAAAPILEVGRLDSLWVEVHVPLDRARGFAPGARAQVDGAVGVRLEGRVVALGRRVHEADRGLLVRVAVDDPGGELIPGQPVDVTLERPAPEDAVRVDRAALLHLGGTSRVFVLRDGIYVDEPIQVLAERDQELVLTGDLEAGAAVVVRGTAALKAVAEGRAEPGTAADPDGEAPGTTGAGPGTDAAGPSARAP